MLRGFLEDRRQGYVPRVRANFTLTLPNGTTPTCAQAVQQLAKHKHRWEIRSAGAGSKGSRWYAWAWIATASPQHSLLIRRHLKTGELAFHYCYVPEGQLTTKPDHDGTTNAHNSPKTPYLPRSTNEVRLP